MKHIDAILIAGAILFAPCVHLKKKNSWRKIKISSKSYMYLEPSPPYICKLVLGLCPIRELSAKIGENRPTQK
jgi:hypothetical protein